MIPVEPVLWACVWFLLGAIAFVVLSMSLDKRQYPSVRYRFFAFAGFCCCAACLCAESDNMAFGAIGFALMFIITKIDEGQTLRRK